MPRFARHGLSGMTTVDGFTAQTAGAGEGHGAAFSRHIMPEVCDRSSLANMQRAQGMPGEGLTH
ncbi:hypothetical protein, partial [Bradyrhizobium sp. SZCCHNS2017]